MSRADQCEGRDGTCESCPHDRPAPAQCDRVAMTGKGPCECVGSPSVHCKHHAPEYDALSRNITVHAIGIRATGDIIRFGTIDEMDGARKAAQLQSEEHIQRINAERLAHYNSFANSIENAKAPYNPIDGMRIHREVMERSRAREAYQAKAATIIAQNTDCFIAQWILQNPDAKMSDYAVTHRQAYEGGFMKTFITIELKGKGQA